MNPIEAIRDYYTAVDENALHAIMPLFDEKAIYSRKNHLPFVGKQAIEDFFKNGRALSGEHRGVQTFKRDGIPEDIERRMQDHFSKVDATQCTTIEVKGEFSGARRYPEAASGLKLFFKDYWVLQNDKVIYRYSDIAPDKKHTPTHEKF